MSSDFHLHPLDKEEVAEYIVHRITKVNSKKKVPFSAGAIEVIALVSRGVPRTINILCDTALVYAFSQGLPGVTKRVIEKVIEDKRKYGVFSGTTGPQEVLGLADRDKSSG